MKTRTLRVFGVAMLLLGVTLTVSPAGSIPITSGVNDITITQVIINDDGTVRTQNASVPVAPSTEAVPAPTYFGGTGPADLLSVTVDDGGTKVLDHFNQSRITVTNVGFPVGVNTGIWVVENNVLTAFGDTDFVAAVERSLPSSDLRDYLEYDFPNIDPTAWGADFDFMFDYPLLNDDYLMMVERNGNTFFDLQALDKDGIAIAGAVINSDAPYRWNTGILPGDTPFGLYQPQWITVLDIEMFGVDTDLTPIHGFRIDNDGQADVKFLGLSDSPFEIDIELEKTVYVGHNSGVSCNGSESVSGLAPGSDITWCFEVVNDGLTDLNAIRFDDAVLGISNSAIATIASGSVPLAPASSITYFVEATVPATDTTNTATVSAQPIDGGGADFPVGRVADTDTAAVGVATAAVSIDKSVYAGHDSGATCAGVDLLANQVQSDDITWCFRVTNPGSDRLINLRISDAQLGLTNVTTLSIVSGSLPLEGGSVITYYLEGSAPAADLTNTASVLAAPVDGSGNSLGSDVTDSDTASVTIIGPDIALGKTVYAGHSASAGSACGSATNSVSGLLVGDDVTWCFRVTNDGDTALDSLALTDVMLGLSSATTMTIVSGSLPLAPSAAIVYVVEGVAPAADATNTATILGIPVNGVGAVIGSPITDSDTASIDVVSPSVSVDKTVYAGHSASAGGDCATAVETETNLLAGDEITWCIEVTNDGDTRLNSLNLTDAMLGLTASTSMAIASGSTPLDPGEVITYFVEDLAPAADATNTATIFATPVNASNTSIGPVIDDTDTAAVQVIDPSLSLEKTVYSGHDSGAGCSTALGSTTLVPAADLTWCFDVQNTGSTILDSLELTDVLLSLTDETAMAIASGALPLASGDTITYYVEAAAPATDTTNSATISGTPVDGGGTPIGTPVTSTNTADVLLINPEVVLAKTIYAGHDAGAGCPGGELVANVPEGVNVTWCFVATNSGDTRLDLVVLNDTLLDIPGTLSPVVLAGSTPLEVGDSISYYVQSTAPAADLTNTATVTATPVDAGGTSIGVPVSDTDTAAVDVIAPSLALEKTVVSGHAAGTNCSSALDEIVVGDRVDVTYCFTVTNTGDTHLQSIGLADPLLGGDAPILLSADSSPLAPGDSANYYAETLTNAVGLTTVNVATAAAQPATAGGVTLPLPVVEDTDTATIRYESTIAGSVVDESGTPIESVELELRDDGGALIATAVTGVDGTYTFVGLLAGTYSVTELQPIGYATVSEHAGSVGGDDSVSNVISSISLPAATAAGEYNFVESSSSIAGTVWSDANDDGVRAASENPIGGVTVALLDAGGSVLATMQTNSAGVYRFDGLTAGTYSVRETQPVGIPDGQDVVGSAGGDASVNDLTSGIVLGAGVAATGYDFGERNNPVSGIVWIDENRDGSVDPAEAERLGNISIELVSPSGTVVATTATNASGFYQFDHVVSGGYTVRQVQPAGIQSTTANELSITVPTGGIANQNFGEVRGSIGGVVWDDANSDGIRGGGENLLGDVVVELTDNDGNIVGSVATAADGSYLFSNLGSGAYRVQVQRPNGSAHTSQNAGTNVEIDSDVDVVGFSDVIGLAAGEDRRFIDAGFVPENRDLAVDISVNKSAVVKGASVTYTVTASNTGNIVVGESDLVLQIPNLVVISKVVPEPGWSCTTTGQKISCHSDNAVNPGDKLPTIQVLGVSQGSGSVNATSSISTTDGPETTLANNTDSVPLRVNTRTLPVTGSSTATLALFGLAALLLGLVLDRVRRLV